MAFWQWIENVAHHIQRLQSHNEETGKTIRERTKNGLNHPEKRLTHPVRKISLEGKIGGVDSGFTSQSFYALDLMLLRSVGVCFTYEKGKMVHAAYCPEVSTLPQPIVNTEDMEREEFHKFVSLTRVKAEAQNTIDIIEKHHPAVCFVDGSLVLHPLDKPSQEGGLKKHYFETIQKMGEMFDAAEKNKCLLIGSVEDSRSTKLSEWIHAHVFQNNEKKSTLPDSALLENVLEEGERTLVFPFADDAEKHSILMDYPTKWKKKIHACYVKPSALDFPLRIEFLASEENKIETANRAAEVAIAQSHFHREYAYPSVLIEADMRAKLKPEEVEMVSDKLLSKLGRNTLRLRRRDRRPF